MATNFWQEYLYGRMPEGFKGTTGFKGGQLRKLDAINAIMESLGEADKFGQTARQDIQSWESAAGGKAKQGAVNRGLFNTSVLDATNRGISSDAQRMRMGVDESILDRKAQLRAAIASILTGGKYGSAPPSSPGFSDYFKAGLGQSLGQLPGRLLFGS